MINNIPKLLFTFEMANNHMGKVSHGKKIIREFSDICKNFPEFNFAFKLQYRDLDSFIHPKMKDRDDIKYIKRFSETRLTREDFDELVAFIKEHDFISMVTPFDENSVNVLEKQNVDLIKVASCSFNDWPLIERIVKSGKPVIASTAGATIQSLDRVVSFLMHRNIDFAILHCVAEYPAPDNKMHLGQIDFLKNRYPNVRVGFSTHENPSNSEIIKLAIAKGANIFEKHVGVSSNEFSLNKYSANPEQVKDWLNAAKYSLDVCGISSERSPVNPIEQDSLFSLRRGVFAARNLTKGETLTSKDIYFAFPPNNDQVTANEWGKYISYEVKDNKKKDNAILNSNIKSKDIQNKVMLIAKKVKKMLEESNITVPGGVELEISHHYGIDRFDEIGLTMITVVNRGYCKKLLVSLPGQFHPEQYHLKKEETFHVLFGELKLSLNGVPKIYKQGDVINIEPKVRHSFVSVKGAVIEEISSTHFANDSFYTDDSINKNLNRKTILTYWMA